MKITQFVSGIRGKYILCDEIRLFVYHIIKHNYELRLQSIENHTRLETACEIYCHISLIEEHELI